MSRVLILYATMSGNTEKVALHISQEIPKTLPDNEVVLMDMMEATEDVFLGFDLIFIGSSTWTDGEFNPIAEEFLGRLSESQIDFAMKKFAVFGLGESYYPRFCTIVEKTTDLIKSKNGDVIGEQLKLDGYVDENMLESVTVWTTNIIHMFQGTADLPGS